MAVLNKNQNIGLRPVGHTNGNIVGASVKCRVLSSNSSNNIYIGDAVKLTGTGDTDGIALVDLAADASDAIYGVVTEVVPTNVYDAPYRAVSTTRDVMVNVDPNTIYECEEDAVGGAIAVTGINSVISLIGGGTGNTNSGYSKVLLDSSTLDAAGTNVWQMRILGAVQRPGESVSATATTAYNKWLVVVNKKQSLNGGNAAGA